MAVAAMTALGLLQRRQRLLGSAQVAVLQRLSNLAEGL